MILNLLKTIFFLPTQLLSFLKSFGHSGNRHLDLSDQVRNYTQRMGRPLNDLEEIRFGSVLVSDDLIQNFLKDKAPSVKLGDVLTDICKGRLHKQLPLQVALGNFIFNGSTNSKRMVDEVLVLATRHGLLTIDEAMSISGQLQKHMQDMKQNLQLSRQIAILRISDLVAKLRGINKEDMPLTQCLECMMNNTLYVNVTLQSRLQDFVESFVTDTDVDIKMSDTTVNMCEAVLVIALQEGVITNEEFEYIRSKPQG